MPSRSRSRPVPAPPPLYPHIRVRISTHDLHIAIGRVAVALRRHAGDDAADTFNAAAHHCLTANTAGAAPHEPTQEVLALIKRTVRVR